MTDILVNAGPFNPLACDTEVGVPQRSFPNLEPPFIIPALSVLDQ